MFRKRSIYVQLPSNNHFVFWTPDWSIPKSSWFTLQEESFYFEKFFFDYWSLSDKESFLLLFLSLRSHWANTQWKSTTNTSEQLSWLPLFLTLNKYFSSEKWMAEFYSQIVVQISKPDKRLVCSPNLLKMHCILIKILMNN